jgi:signal transduction histidine kinase
LTNAQQILSLGANRARRDSQPVRLRGTIVLVPKSLSYAFLHDETACILVMLTNHPPEMVPGKLAEVQGWTEAGVHAPLVDRAAIALVGDAPIPQGIKVPVARMRAGEACWQWVRIEGVVRDMNRDVPNLALSIASENDRFGAFVYGYEQFSRRGLPLDWLEARVVMEGICWTEVNDRNQPFDFHLVMAHTNTIRFLRKGTTNLFAPGELPLADAARLRQPSDDRLLLPATVLASFPDQTLFLRTKFGPVQARLSPPISRGMPTTELVGRPESEPVGPGDDIELVAAPAESRFAPLLVDGEYRKASRHARPTATSASVPALSSGQYDSDLIRVKGRLLSHDRRRLATSIEEALVLQAGDTVFEAAWWTDGTNALPALPINARIEADGICVVQPGPANVRRSFKVLLRDAGDVRYLGQAHFWNQPGMARILAIGSALALGGSLWVLLLRGQVRQRTGELATANLHLNSEIEERRKAQADLKQALAAERELSELKSRFVSLVSHEFRTPLGITMSAVELLRNYLDRLPQQKLRELLDDIYSSTLRMSGLMEQVLLLGRVEAGRQALNAVSLDLAGFGAKQADEALSASKGKCQVKFAAEGDLAGAKGDETLLRHIFSNLLSNAVKYTVDGHAVDFRVKRDGRDAIFTVRDHGIGIPEPDQAHLFEAFHRATNVGQIPGTGLGLLIVKRCLELHDGSINFESRLNQGTTFTVRLPLFVG